MTGKSDNPLRPPREASPSALLTNPDLQMFCDDNNKRAARMGVDWWYRVVKRTNPDGRAKQEVEKTEGHRAIEFRREHDEAQRARRAAAARNPAGE